ncbi:Bromodomain-domain-containing protein [Piromyces finnis]|uniref:Bromodomain-domain-containing protein n=1 Tax=Piromyces finnis TaxID=1754191 RepID=A0A1Y1V988_9FUNG|nr:Bromodomain-domain-containing protein [Piromyces finnis]|eukprot:ORX50347.1 Bromodomain-domain-containing protein [Piromyces finnis]
MLKALKRHPDSGPFLHPVDPVALNVPDYFDIIKNPMDLTTLQSNLNNGKYVDNPNNFISDTRLIFTNCYTYNGINSQISEMAKALEKVFENMLKKMPQEVGDHSSYGSKTKANHSNISKKHPKKVTLKGDLKFCKEAINEMLKKKYSNINIPFLQPVDPIALGVPDYYTVITNPMDLSTLRKKLENGEYESADQFETDCRLIFSNCYIYNHPDSEVYKMGQRLEEVFNNKWKHRPLSKELPAPEKKTNKKNEDILLDNHNVIEHSSLRQTTTIKVETNEYSSESDFSEDIEKQQNREIEPENVPMKEEPEGDEFLEYNDAEEEEDDEDEDDDDKNVDTENLKREINQLQKTLQICTERLSLLLEKKSQAVARKAKKEKKLKLAGKLNKMPKQKIPKLKTSKVLKPSNVTKPKSKDDKDIQDVFEEENDVYSLSKTPSPKKDETKLKHLKQSKSKLKRKNEIGDSDSEVNVNKIPVITMEQKKELSESINNLPPEKLGEVVQIIQESMSLETGQEEIELDIDSFDPTTLYRLYRIVVDNKSDIPVSKRRKIQKSYSKQKNKSSKQSNSNMDDVSSSSSLSDTDSDSDDTGSSSN